MIIKNVRLTSYGEYRPCDTAFFGKAFTKQIAPYVVNGYLTEDLSKLRELIDVVGNYGREIIIAKDGFEFFDSNY